MAPGKDWLEPRERMMGAPRALGRVESLDLKVRSKVGRVGSCWWYELNSLFHIEVVVGGSRD